MTNKKEGCGSQRRVMRIAHLLAGHTLNGLRLVDIARAVEASSATVLRDLAAMADEGWAERISGMEDRWRLGPRAGQIGVKFHAEMGAARTRLANHEQRYTRDPN